MKKTQMALAAVALVASTAAMANGVTVSGRFDIGYMAGSGSADLNGAKSVTGSTADGAVTYTRAANGTLGKALNTGLLAPNFLNFSGSEDLGNGMKASFMVSSIINSAGFNSGTVGTAQSWVGLSGDFGGIKLGQTVDSFAGTYLSFDVSGGSNIGSAVSALFAHGASGVFHDRSIQVTAPSVAGVNVAATYIVQDGTTAGSASKAGDFSIAGSTDIGSIKLGAGYSKANALSNTSSFLGAGTDLGFAKVNVLYLSSGDVGTAGLKASTSGINAEIPVAGALTARVGYYNTSGTNTTINGTTTVVTGLYALSPRTTAFANWEQASGNVLLGGGNGGYGTAGSIATLGVAHSF
jgi:predicted porin